MDYEKFLEQNKDEMIASLQAVLRCNSEQTDAVRTAWGEVYPFGEGVQKAFVTFLKIAEEMGFVTYNADNYGGHVDFVGTGRPVKNEEGEIVNYEKPKVLGILGHLDVVPAGGGWDFDPYGANMAEGKIYGRGTTDDKGPMVSCLYAMKALKDAGHKPQATIRLIIGLDEETNWKGMDYYFSKAAKPDFGFTPDGDFPVINGEKGILVFELAKKFSQTHVKGLELRSLSGGAAANSVADSCRVVVRNQNAGEAPYVKIREEITKFREETGYKIHAKGIGKSLEITTTGISAHGAKPEAGLNAISIMMEFLGRLNFVNEDHNDFIEFYNRYIGFCLDGEHLGINFSDEVSGGLVFNVGIAEMNEKAGKLTINVRYPVTLEHEKIYETMAETLERYNIGLIKEKLQEPSFMDTDSPMIRLFMDIYRKHTGDTESHPLVIGGGTYARAAEGIVAYGAQFPDDEDLMHRKNEALSLKRLTQMTKIYAEAIYKLSSEDYNS